MLFTPGTLERAQGLRPSQRHPGYKRGASLGTGRCADPITKPGVLGALGGWAAAGVWLLPSSSPGAPGHKAEEGSQQAVGTSRAGGGRLHGKAWWPRPAGVDGGRGSERLLLAPTTVILLVGPQPEDLRGQEGARCWPGLRLWSRGSQGGRVSGRPPCPRDRAVLAMSPGRILWGLRAGASDPTTSQGLTSLSCPHQHGPFLKPPCPTVRPPWGPRGHRIWVLGEQENPSLHTWHRPPSTRGNTPGVCGHIARAASGEGLTLPRLIVNKGWRGLWGLWLRGDCEFGRLSGTQGPGDPVRVT